MSASRLTGPTLNPVTGTLYRHRWAALVVLMFPVLLISVDNTVLSFAVPALSAALTPTGNQLLWVIDIYPLVLAGLLVPMGSLGDRFGRRRLLLIGSIGFAAVSAAAAFASSAEQLIAARAGLGIFGAMLMPATLSLIRNIFSDPIERRKAIAIWAAGFSGGAALGPIVGGFLLEHFWWGSVFLMAVPMLIPLVVLAPVLVPESRDPKPGPIDPISIGLVIMTLLPIVYAIKELTTAGSPLVPFIAIAVGITAGVTFTRRQLKRRHPMLDVRLFANPSFSSALMVNLLSIFALVGFIYFISQHLQLVAGYTPMMAGVLLIPGLVLTVSTGFLAVSLTRRFAVKHVMVWGLGLNALAYGIVMLTGQSGSVLMLMVAFSVLGAGVGLSETLSNDMALSAVPPAQAGAASAISETAYEVGSVLGTAVLGSILNAVYRSNVAIPGQLRGEAAENARQTLGGAHEAAATLSDPVAARLMESAAHAFDKGVLYTSAIAMVLTVVSAVIVTFALRSVTDEPSTEHEKPEARL
ncbi:MAG: MFS transporter [Micrococcaceae bacterium]|nr:MFS transporter [Micrococcaceae bacterium]